MSDASVHSIDGHWRFKRRESEVRLERHAAEAEAEKSCDDAIERGYLFATVKQGGTAQGLEQSVVFSKTSGGSAIDIAKAGTDASNVRAVIADIVAKYRESIPAHVRNTGVFRVFRQSAYYQHGDQLLPEEDLLRRWQNVALRIKNMRKFRQRIYVTQTDIYSFPLNRQLTGELAQQAHELDDEMSERLYPGLFLRGLKDEMMAKQGEKNLPREELVPKDRTLTVQECFEGKFRLRLGDSLLVPKGVPVEDASTGEFSLLDGETTFSVVQTEGYDIRLKSSDNKRWCKVQFDDRNGHVRYLTS